MAEHDHTPSPPLQAPPAEQSCSEACPSAIGLVAVAAASAADLAPANPDAELLAVRPRLEAAVREVNASK